MSVNINKALFISLIVLSAFLVNFLPGLLLPQYIKYDNFNHSYAWGDVDVSLYAIEKSGVYEYDASVLFSDFRAEVKDCVVSSSTVVFERGLDETALKVSTSQFDVAPSPYYASYSKFSEEQPVTLHVNVEVALSACSVFEDISLSHVMLPKFERRYLITIIRDVMLSV